MKHFDLIKYMLDSVHRSFRQTERHMDERTALLQRMLGFANCYLASRGKKREIPQTDLRTVRCQWTVDC